MKFLILTPVLLHIVLLSNAWVIDLPGQCPSVKPFSDYKPTDLIGELKVMALSNKGLVQLTSLTRTVTPVNATTLKAVEVQKQMDGEEKQIIMNFTAIIDKPGVFIATRLENEVITTFDGYMLSLIRRGSNPIGFGYCCRNKDASSRQEAVMIWNKENAVVDNEIVERVKAIEMENPELQESFQYLQVIQQRGQTGECKPLQA